MWVCVCVRVCTCVCVHVCASCAQWNRPAANVLNGRWCPSAENVCWTVQRTHFFIFTRYYYYILLTVFQIPFIHQLIYYNVHRTIHNNIYVYVHNAHYIYTIHVIRGIILYYTRIHEYDAHVIVRIIIVQ